MQSNGYFSFKKKNSPRQSTATFASREQGTFSSHKNGLVSLFGFTPRKSMEPCHINGRN
jgi:hypothetical protein